MSTQGSFNNELIEKLLIDKSSSGMQTAINLSVKLLETEKLIKHVPTLSKSKRFRMYDALLKENRTDVIEEMYNRADDLEQIELLMYASEEFFMSKINEDLIASFTEKHWYKMAKRFPNFTKESVVKFLEKTPKISWTARIALKTVLYQFFKFNKDIGIELLEQTSGYIHESDNIFIKYFTLFPNKVAKLLINAQTKTSFKLPIKSLKKLDSDLLCELVDKNRVSNIKEIFRKLPLNHRIELYKYLGDSFRLKNGELPLSYVEALPKVNREKEALHTFNLEILATDVLGRLEYLGVLDFEHALKLADPFLKQPEGGTRAKAVAAIVHTGRYYPENLDLILDFCLKRKNEQDPVKNLMLEELGQLPAQRWNVSHLEKIEVIITDVLSARDCSYQTMNFVAKLLFNIIHVHIDFVVAQLPRVIERMGNLSVYSLQSKLTNEDIIKLDESLYPVLKTWAMRDKAQVAVSVISSFGCRIKSTYNEQKIRENKAPNVFKMFSNKTKPTKLKFVQLLIDLTEDKRGQVARLGVDTLKRLELVEELNELIPKLLKQDPSWIRVETVSQHLHKHRQDLLDYYLEPRVYKNRFDSGITAILPSWANGFVRWTANQQRKYAKHVYNIINSDKRNAWELRRGVKRLSVMPSIEIDMLVEMAKVDAKDIALRDFALTALGKLDAGRGVETLIQALDDDRARIAIYALRRSILEMSETNAFELLKNAPKDKVTVAKEIVRLIGEFNGEESYLFLREYIESEKLHPDVKIAILRGFWKHLNRDEVWGYFNEAATNGTTAIARSTIHIPQAGLSVMAQQNLSKQMALLLQNDDAQIRRETVFRLVSMPLGSDDERILTSLVNMLNEVDTNTVMYTTKALLAGFVFNEKEKLVDAFMDINRPKAFEAVVDGFTNRMLLSRNKETDICAEMLIDVAIKQGKYPALVVRLLINTFPPSKILADIDQLENKGLLHPGVVEYNQIYWKKVVDKFSIENITDLELKLRQSKSENIRRIGFSLFLEICKQKGWTEERVNILSNYKDDESLWVSETAGLIEAPKLLEE